MQVTTNEMVLFWNADSIYSNWYQSCYFHIEDVLFHNAEAAFMWVKALHFKDYETAQIIEESRQNPGDMKALGRQVKNFNESEWVKVRYQIMFDVCLQKFHQIELLKDDLLATGDRILVEASPYDKIWGIGLAPDNPLALNPDNWKGLNLLGRVLEDVRTRLR